MNPIKIDTDELDYKLAYVGDVTYIRMYYDEISFARIQYRVSCTILSQLLHQTVIYNAHIKGYMQTQ